MNTNKTYKHTARACYLSFVSQAIVINLAPLLFVIFQDWFDVTLERIGLLIMVNFTVMLIVAALMVRLADRIGHRRLMVCAHVLCAVGLLALSFLPRAMAGAPYAGLVIATVLYALGGGLIEVLASPIADALPGERKAASMSLLHSFYCWGHVLVVLLTTGLLTLFGTERWYLLPIFWAIIPAYNAWCFLSVPLVPEMAESERMPLKTLMTNRLFLLAVLLMVCAGASEQAMSQWVSLFAEKGLHVTKVMGDLLGPCLFAVLMGFGRVMYGLFGDKIRLTLSLMLSAVLCVACYLVAALSAQPLIALIGCAVCGLSVSLMWPGMLSLSARTFAGGGTAMFSLLALGGSVGCAIGPWFSGVVSGASEMGLRAGMLAAVVFPVLLLIGVAWMGRKRGGRTTLGDAAPSPPV